MVMDVMKILGFGTYPDWRWRHAMKYANRIEHADTAAEYFAGPEEEALLADETLVTFAFPYLKRRLHPEAGHDIPESHMVAMELALDAATEEVITPNSSSLNLEAGVLGRRPPGNLLSDASKLTAQAQILYERLFFDVRPFLDDTAALCHVLFHDKERIHRRGAFDLLCKVTAYGLGFAEYRQWRGGSTSGRVKTTHAALNYVIRYMGGLELLGVDAPDDMAKVLARFFVVLPSIIAQGENSTGAGRRYHTYSLDEMTSLSDMIPCAASAVE